MSDSEKYLNTPGEIIERLRGLGLLTSGEFQALDAQLQRVTELGTVLDALCERMESCGGGIWDEVQAGRALLAKVKP